MSPFLFLCGFEEIAVLDRDATAFFELCRFLAVSPKRTRRLRSGEGICCLFGAYSAARLKKHAAQHGLCLQMGRVGGVPHLLGRLFRRPGMLAGIACGICLLLACSLFVWDVEVSGNDTIATEEVLEALSLAGLSKGSFLPTLDPDEIALALRQGEGRIAYAAVNLTGTVASVQIREAESVPPPTSREPANLVAKCDGVVTTPLVFAGQCLVREGDVVRKGQILASGVLESENNGLRFVRASGQVMARTVQSYRVFVPFEYEQSVPCGRDAIEISLLFFGREQKVFKNGRKSEGECDIIENVKEFSLPNGRALPIGIRSVRTVRLSKRIERRSAVQARELAYAELSALLARECPSRALLQKEVELQVSEEGITLLCTVVTEQDIALVAEFSKNP